MADIFPPNSTTVTIATNATVGAITGDMSAYVVPVGSKFLPGSNAGSNGPSRAITSWTLTGAGGTGGATFTFNDPFPSSYTGSKFSIDTGPASGTNAYLVNQNTRTINYFQRTFGPGLSLGDSMRFPLNRKAGANNFTSYATTIDDALAFQIFQKEIAGAQFWSVQASPDGSSLIDALLVSRLTGSIDVRTGTANLTAAAVTDIGGTRDPIVIVSGSGSITSFGSEPRKTRTVIFFSVLTLVHNISTLNLPGGANITTAGGDVLTAVSDASGNWRVTNYTRANGRTLAAAYVSSIPGVAGPPPVPDTTVVSGMLRVEGDIKATGVFRGAYHVIGEETVNDVGFLGFSNAYGPGFTMYGTATGGGGKMFFNMGGAIKYIFETTGHLVPGSDNLQNLGSGGARMGVLFAGGGVVTTSDARLKTPVVPLLETEIAAACDLARAIGVFQFVASVAEKGENARAHVGMTVQRAIQIMRKHGLDPFRYGFICRDRWDAQDAVMVEDGNGEEWEAMPAKDAGDVYSFRTDQLALFIARGQEARLAAIEERIAA